MGIKDLFNKGHSLKSLKNKSQDDVREDLESQRYVDSYSKKSQRFLPGIDFNTASNFARFGLAEEYYDAAIKRIYQTYPYDGSRAEKVEWENESTYLDLFLFENEYPRTNGFITLGSSTTYTGDIDSTCNIFSSSSPQYVFIKGGPHPDPGGDYKSTFSAGKSKKGISKANIYHTGSQRSNNLELDLSKGVTVEFWMKKDNWATGSQGAPDEYLFHLWNSGSVVGSAPSNCGLQIYTSGSAGADRSLIHTKIFSGSTTVNANFNTGLSDIADGKWHHYAYTARTSAAKTILNLYVDGVHIGNNLSSRTVSTITGTMLASIGSLVGPLTGAASAEKGWGAAASASFDEFRYWKTERTPQQIGRFYRDQVGGGTNTDNIKYDDVSNKVDLGVYYKFNEGIVGTSTTDESVLDYSGRISNGTLVNYATGCRSTGSAIVISEAATKEFKDPILYSTHSDVSDLITSKKDLGRAHDHNNPSSLYKSVPAWIADEDDKQSGHLKYLMQILGSYFDDLYLQIERLSKLKDINYPDDNKYEKPLPFADRLLETRGYDAPELFADASALAKYMERSERKLFEKKLYEVKNIIYQNIYNNLSYIQKSKGTYKSLRNFLRCFGVDEELVKLNIYANNDVYEFKDNFTNTALRKKFLDFDDAETKLASSSSYQNSFQATAYQYKNSSHENTISYIPGLASSSISGAAMTIEAEVILPKRTLGSDANYNLFPSLTSSIFGLHAVVPSDTDLSYAVDDTINFNVVVGKSPLDKRNGHFCLTTSGSSNIIDTDIESSDYIGLYDNQKWNLAFRLRPTNYPLSNLVKHSISGSDGSSGHYTYELYGNNCLGDNIQNEFVVTGTADLNVVGKFFTEPKRLFIGAARQNFTGSVQQHSDVKVSSVRAWYSYIDNEAMRAHGRDAGSHGALHPLRNANLGDKVSFLGTKVPQIKTLVLNWNMDNITGSDDAGRFYIDDFSSGSADTSSYGPWTSVLENNYTGRGDFFESDSSYREQAVDVEFVQTSRQKLPEVVSSDDMVKVLNKQDDLVFTRDTTYVQHMLSVEKSMYQTISEEMIRSFASVVDFNNLVGDPVNRYRPYYKKLEKLKQLFFERVEADADLEKFIEYYKWIDDAVTVMIAQLIPASANTVELLRNMVESHVLERNKYWVKFPTLETVPHNPISSLKGIEELKYNWKFGHAPLNPEQNTNQNQNCLWWKQRAERDGANAVLNPKAGGDSSTVDLNKDEILHALITEVTGAGPRLNTSSGTRYVGGYYSNRSLARPVDLEGERTLSFKGGGNSQSNIIHDFYKTVIKWSSDDDFIYLDADNEITGANCKDQDLWSGYYDRIGPEVVGSTMSGTLPGEFAQKKRFNSRALTMLAHETDESNAHGTGGKNDHHYNDSKNSLLLPFSMYSSSTDTGYRQFYITGTMPRVEFTNLHEDKYGPSAEIPMQGPFTEQHVGGMQHRHISLNQGSDTSNLDQLGNTRPEGWHLQEFIDFNRSYMILEEKFHNAPASSTTDVTILDLPSGSFDGDTSEYEYWRNSPITPGWDNPWSFMKGSTPSVGTGPSSDSDGSISTGYAYCEVNSSQVDQTFGLVTPLIDLLDISNDSSVIVQFKYHMFGGGIGTLRIQASSDPNFGPNSEVEDLVVGWNVNTSGVASSYSRQISGEQHSSHASSWHVARISNLPAKGMGLGDWIGKRFYLRFLYMPVGHLGDAAIDDFYVMVETIPGNVGSFRNSFKLLHPTHDDHNKPVAIYTRDGLAKRPVNIRNVSMSGSSNPSAVSDEASSPLSFIAATPTKAGNYLDRYEYVSTVSPEANDPYFVKNADQITQTKLRYLASSHEIFGVDGTSADPAPAGGASIETILSATGSKLTAGRSNLSYVDYTLPDRSFISGSSIRNRTRIKTRFSSPGGFETLSRGYLDPAHETYSPNNAMTFRNAWIRKVYNSQLQSHSGRFGVSTHDVLTARVYGSEAVGSINTALTGASSCYDISGDASRHKYHRNNLERLEVSGSRQTFNSKAVYFDGSNDHLRNINKNPLSLDDMTISAWIKFESDMTDNRLNSVVSIDQVASGHCRMLFVSGAGASRTVGYRSAYSTTSGSWYTGDTISAGQWYHIAVAVEEDDDKTAAAGIYPSFYINGKPTNTVVHTAPTGSIIRQSGTTGSLSFGWGNNGTGSSDGYFKGAIDETSLWNKKLSANEVSEIYRRYPEEGPNNLLYHSAVSNLVGWHRFGDAAADPVQLKGLTTYIDNVAPASPGISGLASSDLHVFQQNFGVAGAGGLINITSGAFIEGEFYTVVTASTYDNAYVSHMIPRSDEQTRWITASLI